jgi:hypothetical protein
VIFLIPSHFSCLLQLSVKLFLIFSQFDRALGSLRLIDHALDIGEKSANVFACWKKMVWKVACLFAI